MPAWAFASLVGLRHQPVSDGVLQKLLFIMAIAPVFSDVSAFAAAFFCNYFTQAAEVFGRL